MGDGGKHPWVQSYHFFREADSGRHAMPDTAKYRFPFTYPHEMRSTPNELFDITDLILKKTG